MKYSSLALQMVITIGLFVYLGWRIDNYWEFRFPIFTISLMFIAITGIFYKLINTVRKDNEGDQ